ncbi:glycosyltransferase family 87 protein [Deltaproteobacteria bacterium IMCC39524]|nr:glycosyltransferase family 87 protein [Deltaproteobacteria bacterium IMCC39524]
MSLSGSSGKWLTKERLRVYPCIFLVTYILVILIWVLMANGVFDRQGRPLGTDFTSFYSAAQLAIDGQAPLAYDFSAQFKAERVALGPELEDFYSFSYPPTFILMLMPLGALPYLLALFVWQGLTLLLFVSMVVKLAGRHEAIILTLAFPAVFVTLGHGQNAFLTAGLFTGALYYLDRKPILAGLLIGLLTFKPHLGVLIPIVLIASCRWRVFFSACISAVSFILVSWVALGTKTWSAFFASTGKTASVLNEGMVSFYKMQSLYTSLRAIGLDTEIAYVLHGSLALFAAIVVLWVWRQDVDLRLKSAALGTGSLLISPFLLDYDLTLLAVPIACLASYGLFNGFRPGLINLLFLAWLTPIMARSLNLLVPIPWAPIIMFMFLYQTIRLCRVQVTEASPLS